mmetsp:Transcript_9109/g.33627  ORF Transcript_9109/g.33627 Transcript_9109/m.33627 type:complete len:200 (+) Transcript_9109:769-1368(+)
MLRNTHRWRSFPFTMIYREMIQCKMLMRVFCPMLMPWRRTLKQLHIMTSMRFLCILSQVGERMSTLRQQKHTRLFLLQTYRLTQWTMQIMRAQVSKMMLCTMTKMRVWRIMPRRLQPQQFNCCDLRQTTCSRLLFERGNQPLCCRHPRIIHYNSTWNRNTIISLLRIWMTNSRMESAPQQQRRISNCLQLPPAVSTLWA